MLCIAVKRDGEGFFRISSELPDMLQADHRYIGDGPLDAADRMARILSDSAGWTHPSRSWVVLARDEKDRVVLGPGKHFGNIAAEDLLVVPCLPVVLPLDVEGMRAEEMVSSLSELMERTDGFAYVDGGVMERMLEGALEVGNRSIWFQGLRAARKFGYLKVASGRFGSGKGESACIYAHAVRRSKAAPSAKKKAMCAGRVDFEANLHSVPEARTLACSYLDTGLLKHISGKYGREFSLYAGRSGRMTAAKGALAMWADSSTESKAVRGAAEAIAGTLEEMVGSLAVQEGKPSCCALEKGVVALSVLADAESVEDAAAEIDPRVGRLVKARMQKLRKRIRGPLRKRLEGLSVKSGGRSSVVVSLGGASLRLRMPHNREREAAAALNRWAALLKEEC
jgi:hypothetical protein